MKRCMNVTETAFWGESGLLILWDTPAGRRAMAICSLKREEPAYPASGTAGRL